MKKLLTFTKNHHKLKIYSAHAKKSLKTNIFRKKYFWVEVPTVTQKIVTSELIVPKKLVCSGLEKFGKNYVQKEKLERKDGRILCTVSSGQDSILTFFILLHTKKTECLEILYCQHFWQTKNFFSSRLIFQISYLVKVPYTLSLPKKFYLTENHSRNWRKKTFCRFSQQQIILTTSTGHTETDDLEKNLNNLLRGTSPTGISKYCFFNSKKTLDFFFPTINQNICLLTKTHLKKNNLEIREEKKRTRFVVHFFGTEAFQITGPQFKNKKRDQNCLKKNRLSRECLIFRQTFDFSNSRRNFSQIKNSAKKIIENGKKIHQNSKPRKADFETINSGDFVAKNEGFYRGKKFSFFKTKQSCSFLLSSKFFKIPINLIKPLKSLNRFTVSILVKLYKFPLLIDITNFSYNFSRNKIRHQLFPFLRSLVSPYFEYLLTKFFKILNEQNQNKEKDFQEVNFVYRHVKLRHLYLKSVLSFSNASTTSLKSQIYKQIFHFFLQKIFFDYKNLSLNYSQIVGLDNFY